MTKAHASEKNDSISKTQMSNIEGIRHWFPLLSKAEIHQFLFFPGVDIKKEEEDLESNELDKNGLPQPGKLIIILFIASNNQFRNESKFSQLFGPCLTSFTTSLFMFICYWFLCSKAIWLVNKICGNFGSLIWNWMFDPVSKVQVE